MSDNENVRQKYPAFWNQFEKILGNDSPLRGSLCVTTHPGHLRKILEFSKSHSEMNFDVLMDLFANDYSKYPNANSSFSVVYHLYSSARNERFFIEVWCDETNPRVDSVHDLFASANWFEREAWDLYGIAFDGHPNLVRILCHNEFVGHPLRKDYPANQFQRLKKASHSRELA